MVDSIRAVANVGETDAYRGTPQFAVSLRKLAVMSLCTFGLYELYWCYRQWDALRRREGETLSPFWRAFFAPLWGFSLFPRMQELTARHGVPATWPAGGLALAFLLLSAAWRLPDPWSLVSFGSFLPLLVVQRSVNALNAAVIPTAERNDRYSGWNVVIIVVGAILLAFAVWAAVSPTSGDVRTTRDVAA